MSAPLAVPHYRTSKASAISTQAPDEAAMDSQAIFPSAFQGALHTVAFRIFTGKKWPLWEIGGDRTSRNVERVRRYVDPIVERALEKKKTAQTSSFEQGKAEAAEEEEPETLLDHLAATTDGKRGIPPVCDQAVLKPYSA